MNTMNMMRKRPSLPARPAPAVALAVLGIVALVMLAAPGVGQAQGDAGTAARPEITLHSCDTGCLIVAVGNMPDSKTMVETRWRLTGETAWQEWDYIDHNPNTRRGSRRTDVDGHLEIRNLPAGTYEVQARFYDPNDASRLSEWSEVASLATETWPGVTNLAIEFPEGDDFNVIVSWTAPSDPQYAGYYLNTGTECQANARQHLYDVAATSVTIDAGRAHGPLQTCVRPHLGGQSANAIARATVPGSPNSVAFAFGEIHGEAVAPDGAETDWSPLLPFDVAYLSWHGDTDGVTILESEWQYRKQGSTTPWSGLTAVSVTGAQHWAIVDTTANAMEVNAQYEFRVRSRSADGWGQWSFPNVSRYEPKTANPTPARNIRITQPRGDDPQSRWVIEWDPPTWNGGHVCGQFSAAMQDWIFDHAAKDEWMSRIEVDPNDPDDGWVLGNLQPAPPNSDGARLVTFVPTEAMKSWLMGRPDRRYELIIVRPIPERPDNWCDRFEKSEQIRYEVFILGASYVPDEFIRTDGDRRVSVAREHVELPESGLMTVRVTAYGVCADCDPTEGPPPYDSTVRSDAEATFAAAAGAPSPPQSLTVKTLNEYDVWWSPPNDNGGSPIVQYRFDGICAGTGFTTNIIRNEHNLWSVDNGHARLHFPPGATFHLKISKSACSRFAVTAVNELGYSSQTVKWEETPNGVPVVVKVIPDLNLVARIPQGNNAQPHPLGAGNFVRITPLTGPAGVFDDPDNDGLTYTLTSSDPSVAHAEVRNQPYSHVYVVAKETPGDAAITVSVNDGKGGTAEQSFSVFVRRSFNPLVYDRNGNGLIDPDEYQQARSDYSGCYTTSGWNDHDNPLECRTGETSHPYGNFITVKELFERTNQKVVPKWDNQTGSKTVAESVGDVELCIEETAGLEADIFPSPGYDDDFTLTPHILPYMEQGTQQWCATISVVDDSAYEPHETIAFLVTGELGDGTKVGGYATLKILDNDGSPVKVDPLDLELTAGQTATYTVSLSSRPAGEMIVEAVAPAGMTVTPRSRLIQPDLWDLPVTFTVSSSNAGTGVINNTVTPSGSSAAYGTAQVRVSVSADAQPQRQSPANHVPTVAAPIGDVTGLTVGGTSEFLLNGVFSYDGPDPLTFRAVSADTTVATVSVSNGVLTVTAVAGGTAEVSVLAQDAEGDRAQDAFSVTVVGTQASQGSPQQGDPQQSSPPASRDSKPTNVRAVAGDGTVTVSWNVSPFYYKGREIDSDRIKHAIRWWQGSNWANPVGENAVGRNDGISVENGVTSYDITGLTNDLGVQVQVRAFFGGNYQEGAMKKGASSTSSGWVSSGAVTPTANSAPTVASAISDATIVNETGTKQVSLSGVFTDADADSLTITAVSSNESVATESVAADHSTLTVTAKQRGTATITVTASDGKATVDDTFTIKVKAAPVVASAIADITELSIEDTRTPSLSGVFSDADGDAIVVTQVESSDTSKVSISSSLTTASDGSTIVTGFTLTAKDSGTATITVTAQDSDDNSVSDAFDVTVVKANNAPTVSGAIADATIVNESGTHQVSLTGVFSDADRDTLTVTAESSATAIATVAVGTDQSSLTVTARKRGTATITVTTADGNGGSAEDQFDVKVKAAPTVASPIADMDKVTLASLPHDIDLTKVFSDADGDALTFEASSADTGVAWGILLQGTLNVAPNAIGTVTFTVTAKDSDQNSISDSFDVTVVNSPPTVAGAIGDATIVSETGTKRVPLSGVFDDLDYDTLTITAKSSDQAIATAEVSLNTLTVTAKKPGTATITVTAKDGNGGSVDDAFTVKVKTAPVVAPAIDDVSDLVIGDEREVSVSGVFSDADSDALTITATSSSDAIAAVAVAADGSGVTLTAKSRGTATVTVTARDSDGNTVRDDFDVVVVNRAPAVANPISDTTIVNESGTHQASLSGVFADADRDSLTITATSSTESVATVSVSADYATLTVSAQARGTATVTVTAADGNGGSVKDTFNITVKAAPVVASAIADVSELAIDDTHEVSMSGVFSDADGDAITVTGAVSSDNTVAVVWSAIDESNNAVTAITVIAKDSGAATITVAAQDADGNTVSDAFDVTVPAAEQQQQPAVELPGPVVGLELTATADSVTVRWNAPETGGAPDGYIVHLRPENGKQGSGTTKRPSADSTTVSFNNLEAGRTYEVWARAHNEAGKGERTNATITLPGAPPEPEEIPGPVIDLQLSATSDSVTVSWSAPETGGTPDGYIVHISPEDGGKGKTRTPKAKKTQVAFKNLEVGRTYQVWVRAQNEAGKGERVHATITLPE